ncbi:MAG: PleD family two-component system response regulator [bacterium]
MKYRILVIDDDKAVLDFLRETLAELYELVLVSDPNEALKIVQLAEPDLILIDVMMPDKNGHQLAQWIRGNSLFSEVPIIMLDDVKKPDNLRSLKESEGEKFLTKPIPKPVLFQTINQILETGAPLPTSRQFNIEKIYEIQTVKYTPSAKITAQLDANKNQSPAPESIRSQPIPVIPESVKHPQKLDAVAPETVGGFHGRILVIDDDKELLQLLRVIFAAEYEYITATDGFLGIRKAMLYLPDIMILDIMMTKLNGFQVCEMVRKQPQLKTVPVVFLSAKSHPTDIEHAKRLGGTEYITKPFDPGTVKHTVEKLLKQYGIKPPGSRISYSEVLKKEGLAPSSEDKK